MEPLGPAPPRRPAGAGTAPAPDLLTRMAASSRRRAEVAMGRVPLARLTARVRHLPPPPALQLAPGGFDLIAEVKRRSPSAGALAAEALKIARQARAYVQGGACALSVLTEPEEFGGSLAHLQEVAAAVPVPAMRKDFIVTPYQLLEARVAGAGGVLLIVAMLDDGKLKALLEQAFALNLFVLVEVFDRPELERACRVLATLGPAVSPAGVRWLLGVNCRDLRSLAVDFSRFGALAPHLPAGVPAVAESGVETPEHAVRVAELGYRLALVGTALMRASDPAAFATGLLAAGRSAARPA